MSILTGSEIYKEVQAGRITIDPFDPNQINPNSYNLRIDRRLLVYRPPVYDYEEHQRRRKIPRVDKNMPHFNDVVLDCHADNLTDEYFIEDSGFMLQPGILYLGTTFERTFTDHYVPVISGRSSTGRLSMSVHVTAGFGDIGFDGKWTLEITVLHNLIIYPRDEMLQVYFETPQGDRDYLYDGRYNHQTDVTASRFYMPKKGSFDFGQMPVE